MNIQDQTLDTAPGIVGSGLSYARDPDIAVKEAMAAIDPSKTCFVIAFIPERLDPTGIGQALNRHLPNTSVFGCTTAGQITPSGYENEALLIISFPKKHFRCSSTLITPLKPVSIENTANEAKRLAPRFPKTPNWNRLALIFADGLS